MAGAKRLLRTPGNFQSSAMFEESVAMDDEGGRTESMLGSSVTACRKMLCSGSVLESAEYWLKSEKALCRLNFLEEHQTGGLTTICFVNLNRHANDGREESSIKRLACVSADLPRLVEYMGGRQPKDNEILLLSGLEPPDAQLTHMQRAADVCVVHCTSGGGLAQPGSIILEINKFLIGLQSGQERQRRSRLAGQRIGDDDTNRSVSSIEEDFLTASEHLGEDSEDDPLRNDVESGGLPESDVLKVGVAQKRSAVEREDSDDSDTLCASSTSQKLHRSVPASSRGPAPLRQVSRRVKESAGHYANNLAESVLQDAFIRLSQDEPSFCPAAAVSISAAQQEPPRARTHSFELPKIVIVQSPDSSEETAEWPGTPAQPHVAQRTHEHGPCAPLVGNVAKPVEVALACAASLIGTIGTPQVAEQLALESGEEDDEEEEEGGSEPDRPDYSLSSAVCGMAQVAGAVAVVDLAEDGGGVENSGEMYSAPVGLLAAAQASAAIPLRCSVAEGTSLSSVRTTVAEVLLKEASAVLTHKLHNTSIAHFLETTHNRLVEEMMRPRRLSGEPREVDDHVQEMADSVFTYALEKALKRSELEGKDAPDIQGFLLDSINSLLFDVLCVTARRISDISKSNATWPDRGDIGSVQQETTLAAETLRRLQPLNELSQAANQGERQGVAARYGQGVSEEDKESDPSTGEQRRYPQGKSGSIGVREQSDTAGQRRKGSLSERNPDSRLPSAETSPLHGPHARAGREGNGRQPSLTSTSGALVPLKMDGSDTRTTVTCFADDLATTVVSMATELAAICLENSSGKQPWFCGLQGATEGPEGLLFPCRTAASALRRKEAQNGAGGTKKHRPPRLSEIKRKTEEQPELMERLVNRVVDETINLDEPMSSDPFALFASEVTARIMNCPELSVVDTSKPGQPSRCRLQCERWSSRGKASSYESIPEEDADSSGTSNKLGPGNRLGTNLSRGSSISKQSSCESITDEFSRFMVNQMEMEGRGFELLLDYYAGKNASNILAAAVQQAASKKNGHLSVRTSSCLSKQSSTESITEEFYRFMLKDMDKENREYSLTKTKEWSNNLLPPSPRSPFCIRQSSVPDRRSSDSRLTVNSPIKANSFDGFARNVHGDSLNIYPSSTVSATGLCKSDSCLYQCGQTDQITDMLIHETWSSSIESLMRKNKIIAEPSEDSLELEAESQPHVQLFANRLAADIVESGKSLLGGQQEAGTAGQQHPHTVGERRRCFKQSRPGSGRSQSSTERQESTEGPLGHSTTGAPRRGLREVPLIHIEADQRDEVAEDNGGAGCRRRESAPNILPQNRDRTPARHGSGERDRSSSVPTAPPGGVEGERRSLSASSEESGSGSWAQVAPDDDPQEETSSFIQLSDGNGTSSASSLGLADLESFPELPLQSGIISEEREHRAAQMVSRGQMAEATSAVSAGKSGNQGEVVVLNFDLDAETVDVEFRAVLQWMAASELSAPTLHLTHSQEQRLAKLPRVVELACQRAWCVGDLFRAVCEFCRLRGEDQQRGRHTHSLLDWLLDAHR